MNQFGVGLLFLTFPHADVGRLLRLVAGCVSGFSSDGVGAGGAFAGTFGAQVHGQITGDFKVASGVANAQAVVRLAAGHGDDLGGDDAHKVVGHSSEGNRHHLLVRRSEGGSRRGQAGEGGRGGVRRGAAIEGVELVISATVCIIEGQIIV